jgi:hypothetical protein
MNIYGSSETVKRKSKMQTIHLEANQVPATLRAAYDGRKFSAEITESVVIPATAGLWDGGSREYYKLVQLSDGHVIPFPGQNAAPWDPRQENEIRIKPGYVVVCHSIFCGKDMGLHFYVHPQNATALLPAPSAELSALEKLILDATRSLKSSYMGRDRYQMKLEDYRHSTDAKNGVAFPTRAEWEQTKAELYAKGYLNKAGAITVKGKNAI